MTEFRISELASATGLPTATLRYYETIGLLTPKRDRNGYRRYDRAHMDRLRFVAGAKRLGLRLDQIAELLELRGDGDCPPVRAKLADLITVKLAEIRESMTELSLLADELSVLAERITGTQPPPACGEGCGCPDHSLSGAEPTVPIACSLQPQDLASRTTDWHALAASADRVEETDAGWRLVLPDTPDLVSRAAGLAAAERGCCPFLSFTLTLAGHRVSLEVRAPADARDLIAELLQPSPTAAAASAG